MKRFLSLLFTALLFTTTVFAVEPGDEYDDGYEYDQNGRGDQFIKFNISGCLPILSADKNSTLFNSDPTTGNKLNPGVSFDLGYYRFLSKSFGIGGEITFTSNWSVGRKLLTIIPITFGVLYQPVVNNFEFPIFATVGLGYESWANYKYFPSLVVKASGGMYYRINESWSAGGSLSYMWIPQWTQGYPTQNGMLCTINIGGRFHF